MPGSVFPEVGAEPVGMWGDHSTLFQTTPPPTSLGALFLPCPAVGQSSAPALSSWLPPRPCPFLRLTLGQTCGMALIDVTQSQSTRHAFLGLLHTVCTVPLEHSGASKALSGHTRECATAGVLVRTACRSRFSSSSTWTVGIKHRLPGLVGSTFTHRAISLAPLVFLRIHLGRQVDNTLPIVRT